MADIIMSCYATMAAWKSNQPFSGWEGIFSDSTMTVVTIDRLVHHSIILDIQAQGFRKHFAQSRNNQQPEHKNNSSFTDFISHTLTEDQATIRKRVATKEFFRSLGCFVQAPKKSSVSAALAINLRISEKA